MKKPMKNFSSFVMTFVATAVVAWSLTSTGCKPKEEENPSDPSTKELVLSHSSVEVGLGETVNVEINDGNGEYVVRSADETIAQATVTGTTISIVGVKAGTTTVSVRDKANKAKPISVQVNPSGQNNINTDCNYTITLASTETGKTNWWSPTLTQQVTGTPIMTKRDYLAGKNTSKFGVDNCALIGTYFDLVEDENIFVCGGYIGEGTKPDLGYTCVVLLLTDNDDPSHQGCKVVNVLSTNLAAALDWAGYTSTPGTAYYNPETGAFTLENCKGYLCWQGDGNQDWIFNLNRTYTPEK